MGLLLDAGAEPDAATTTGWTALHAAASEGHAGVCGSLAAALLQQAQRLRLRRHGGGAGGVGGSGGAGGKGRQQQQEEEGQEGGTGGGGAEGTTAAAGLAASAASAASAEAARVLDAKNAFGRTPLHCAAAEGRVAAATVLLRRGADGAARTPAGESVEDLAANYGHAELAQLIADWNEEHAARKVHHL